MNPTFPTVELSKALGESEAFLDLQERLSRAAKTERPVILIGERGTGKELAASRLHFLSPRWNLPYVTINCSSLSESLIESELFGHEAGAFTGAMRQRKGRFEMANGGTLFLDEIATLPVTVQEKILRVVEYGTMERVGSSETIRVDARLVAATNADLRALAREGRFRQDLLDRLCFEVIVLPPLRERREDILPLARHFARQMAVELSLPDTPGFAPQIEKQLLHYDWPGNIRELKNVVERMVYRAGTSEITEIVFDPFGPPSRSAAPALAPPPRPDTPSPAPAAEPGMQRDLAARLMAAPLPEALRELEIVRLRAALEECRFNQRKAATRLGLTYHQLRACLRKYRDLLEA
jgi:psp operon transcriptional activator